MSNESNNQENQETSHTERKSFWATLPGILTALSSLIVAITGLIIGLNAAGLVGLPPPTETPTETPTPGILVATPPPDEPPTETPTAIPTTSPSHEPPTDEPLTETPTAIPTTSPSHEPPTAEPPTETPTVIPTTSPSHEPPTAEPPIATPTLTPLFTTDFSADKNKWFTGTVNDDHVERIIGFSPGGNYVWTVRSKIGGAWYWQAIPAELIIQDAMITIEAEIIQDTLLSGTDINQQKPRNVQLIVLFRRWCTEVTEEKKCGANQVGFGSDGFYHLATVEFPPVPSADIKLEAGKTNIIEQIPLDVGHQQQGNINLTLIVNGKKVTLFVNEEQIREKIYNNVEAGSEPIGIGLRLPRGDQQVTVKFHKIVISDPPEQ